MDYGVFQVAARGLERKHGGRRFFEGGMGKNKLDCFNKLCIFKVVTFVGCLHSIGWKGESDIFI